MRKTRIMSIVQRAMPPDIFENSPSICQWSVHKFNTKARITLRPINISTKILSYTIFNSRKHVTSIRISNRVTNYLVHLLNLLHLPPVAVYGCIPQLTFDGQSHPLKRRGCKHRWPHIREFSILTQIWRNRNKQQATWYSFD